MRHRKIEGQRAAIDQPASADSAGKWPSVCVWKTRCDEPSETSGIDNALRRHPFVGLPPSFSRDVVTRQFVETAPGNGRVHFHVHALEAHGGFGELVTSHVRLALEIGDRCGPTLERPGEPSKKAPTTCRKWGPLFGTEGEGTE